MAHRIVAELREEGMERRVAIEIAAGMVAVADGRLMEIALRNLLGNAWKFTARNPNPAIAFGVIERGDPPTYFVRDNGVGFDMAYAGKLFTPFQRLHSAAEFDGTGIGLATVSRIVHRHGGEIRIDSAVGVGTAVHFTLHGGPRAA
jgi:light-regulated signal transduction histidine kinase (bacteriophytochrome)